MNKTKALETELKEKEKAYEEHQQSNRNRKRNEHQYLLRVVRERLNPQHVSGQRPVCMRHGARYILERWDIPLTWEWYCPKGKHYLLRSEL